MQLTNYDSDFCGKLPIHLTNLIQPYGVLLVVDNNSGEIIQCSENALEVFGKDAVKIVGTSVSDMIAPDQYNTLLAKLGNKFNEKIPAVWHIGNNHHLVVIHKHEAFYLVEIEIVPIAIANQESFVEVYQELKYAMSTIEATSTLEETCSLAAQELKRISGFDKVMIYSFDEDWNGTVLAEEKEEDMESYYGFTFPASDIPAQARQLYLKNSYRFIPDRNYTPVKLHPVVNPVTRSFLDLSDCNLRSVAAVHVEYLKNMGVVASMSTRILHEDKLWGLIACHHKTARYLNYEMLSIFEMLSGIISAKITSLSNRTRSSLESLIATTYAQMVETIFRHGDLDKNLLSSAGAMKLLSASGAAISRNGRIEISGDAPRKDQIEELLLWLHTRNIKTVFHTDRLSAEYEYANDFTEVASGLLVIPINSSRDSYLMMFRPELIRTINWGGNPEERIQFEKDQRTYHPRHSFKEWQQKVSGISLPWRQEELTIAETMRSFIYEFETSR